MLAASSMPHKDARETNTHSPVRWATVAEESKIVRKCIQPISAFAGLCHEPFISVLPLRSGCDLHTVPEEVEAPCEVGTARLAHVIERTAAGRVIGDKEEIVLRLCRQMFGKNPLALAVQIIMLGQGMTQLLEKIASLLKGDFWERQRWRDYIDAEDSLHVLTMDSRAIQILRIGAKVSSTWLSPERKNGSEKPEHQAHPKPMGLW